MSAPRPPAGAAAGSLVVFPLTPEQAVVQRIARETANGVFRDSAAQWDEALQVFGARGYSRDCPVERMVRDARMFTVAGGTVQMLRNLVANRLLGRADQPEERR